MTDPLPPRPRRKSGIILTILLIFVLSALLLIMGNLAKDVQSRLTALEHENSDNGQWVMMQTEVEVLRLQLAVRSAIDQIGSIAEVRRWFDVLYSRIHLLETSLLYRRILETPKNRALMQQLTDFQKRWVPVFDGPEEQLIAALPQLEAENALNQGFARTLSLSALESMSQETDDLRGKMTLTLLRLAMTTAATVALLAVLALVLRWLYGKTLRQAEENRITGERLRTIIANSPDAIAVTDLSGHVLEFNPQAERIFGIHRDSVMGKEVLPSVFPREEVGNVTAVIGQAVNRATFDGPQRFELRATRGKAERFPLEVSIALGPQSPDPAGMIVAFMRDVSERHAAQEAVQDALEKARAGEKAKANFMAVISHEMRTPLNGLIGSVELMRETELTTHQQDLLRVISISSDILLSHVNSVLDITVTESGRFRLVSGPFDLDRLIQDCLDNQAGLASAGGNTLCHQPLTGPLGIVIGDQGRLRQILLNLVGNAVKFTRNGEITLETERQPTKADGTKSDVVEFRVIDTGIGIAEEDCERIFEDFETVDSSYGRNSGGTGLGLGIVRRLVRAMGGQIGVESELGEGSVFWVRLPLLTPEIALEREAQAAPALAQTAQDPEDTPPAKAEGPAPNPLRILVIEDNEINRFLLLRHLTTAKHEVVEAKDGLEGVEMATSAAFDVILTDISMPNLDGVEAAKRIRASDGPSASARIIAVTAQALPADIARFRAAGIDACMVKPISRDALLTKIHQPNIGGFEDGSKADGSLIDPSPILSLAKELGGATTQGLVERMIAEGDATMARMAVMTEMTDQIAQTAHHLAGSCATFGALQLCAALQEIENHIKTGDPDSAAKRMADVPQMWDDCRAILVGVAAQLGKTELPAVPA